MKGLKDTQVSQVNSSPVDILKALDQVHAIVEFNMDGTISTANQNFLKMLGYQELEQVRNKHHGGFCDRQFLSTVAYHDFWNKLGRGHSETGLYMYIGRGGQEVWVQASYIPGAAG